MRDLPLLAGFLIMMAATFVRPHVGVLVWCWTALLVPNVYVYGLAEGVRFNFWIAGATILSWLISKEAKRFPSNGTLIVLGLLFVQATLSTILSIAPSSGVAWTEWEKFVKILALVFIITALINSELRMKALLFAIALSMGFHGTIEGMKFLMSGGGHAIMGPGSSIIGDNNHFALAVVMIIPILLYIYAHTSNPMVRMGIVGCLVLQVVTIVGTASRGGFIGILALAAYIFLTTKRKVRVALIALVLAAVALAAAPQRWHDRMETIQTADQDTSFMGRVIAWKINTLVALDHPLLGGGFRSSQDFAVWNAYAQRFALLDFIPTDGPDPTDAHAAHSIYFQVLGDMGFVGLAIYIALLVSAWRNSAIAIRQARDRPELKWAGDLARTLQYSMIPYVVSGAALNMAYFDLAYVVFALLIVLRRLTASAVTSAVRIRMVPAHAR